MEQKQIQLDYHATSFSQGRMSFTWKELSDEDRRKAYADWEAGKGLMGGDPLRRPNSDKLPPWGLDQPFFRALALEDRRGQNGALFGEALGSTRPVEIEIGFGRGDFLLDRAPRHPETLFLGYEVKTKATRLCLQRIQRGGIDNLWLSDDDCRFSMPRLVADGRVDAIHILFPDPWWKEQHWVKRLFSPPFVDLLAAKLRPGGLLHFKSDVQEYGELVCYLVEQHNAFSEHSLNLSTRVGDHAPTHREYWCQKKGKPIFTYYFERR